MQNPSFGTAPDGSTVAAVKLRSGALSATILTLGARLTQVRFNGSPDLSASPETVEQALGNLAYNGPIIGPVANRIRGAVAVLDGKSYSFPANQSGLHTLHSGQTGTQARQWSVVAQSESAASLEIALEDGLDGFPGNRLIRVTYDLNDAELTVRLTAETDRATLMNPVLHGVWNLDGSPKWRGHRLEIAADTYLPVTKDVLPTGDILSVDNTSFDYRQPRDVSRELDHNFCLNGENDLRFAARLSGLGGRQLEVLTTAPGLQVYSGSNDGIALEPQLWPDATNHPNFPSILLEPDRQFQQVSVYRFCEA